MIKHIESIRKTRKYILDLVRDLSTEELNLVPPSFNNNIIWNLAHMMSVQQGVCYSRASVPLIIEERLFLSYKPGTRPTQFVNPNEIEDIKSLLLSTLDQFEVHYQKHLFNNYTAWSTRYGIEITCIEEAMQFLTFHEGMHMGVIMALKRLVAKQ